MKYPQLSQLEDMVNELILNVSTLKNKSQLAKTQTKRDFYNKKISKISKDVQQLLATIELIKITNNKNNTHNATVTSSTI